MRTEQSRLHLFVAISRQETADPIVEGDRSSRTRGDRTFEFAFAQLHERATRWVSADFLHALVAAVPYRIHTVLTDNSLPRA